MRDQSEEIRNCWASVVSRKGQCGCLVARSGLEVLYHMLRLFFERVGEGFSWQAEEKAILPVHVEGV
jgi:hypothetical protein